MSNSNFGQYTPYPLQYQENTDTKPKGLDIDKVTLGQVFRFIKDEIEKISKPNRESIFSPPTNDMSMYLPGSDVNGKPDYVLHYPKGYAIQQPMSDYPMLGRRSSTTN